MRSFDPDTIPGHIRAGERILNVPDLMETDAYRRGDRTRHALVHLANARSILAAALHKDADILGWIQVARSTTGPFTDRQVALLQNFSAQAVIAMENARLITEQHEALEQQTATAEVLGVINANPGNLTPVFDIMLEKAARLCDTPSGIFWILQGDTVHVAAQRGFSEALAAFFQTPFKPGPNTGIARLVAGADVVVLDDIAAGPGYRAGDPMHRAAVDLDDCHSLAAVPLLNRPGFVGGFLL